MPIPSVLTHYHSKYLAHRLTLEGAEDESFARSLAVARVDLNPHQVDAALFALKSPLSKGVMLADEVGLGKTIEASLVIAQKWAEQKRRILLIVPASLRKQWEQELIEKFNLPSVIIEAKSYSQFLRLGMSRPFEQPGKIVICSYEFAARNRFELHSIPWDLAILDEAHRLRNFHKKSGSQRAKFLASALDQRFKLLLTATPLQNSLLELYGLVSFIDDKHFGSEQAFKALYADAASNIHARARLKKRLEPIIQRTLRRQVVEAGHINYTKRIPFTFNFEPKDEEALLYEGVSSFLQNPNTVSYGDRTNALVILQVRKILGSSTFAVAKYLEQLIERLKLRRAVDVTITDDIEIIDEIADAYDESDETETAEPVDPAKLEAEIAALQTYLDLAKRIGSNAKGEKLIEQLPSVLDQVVSKGGQRKAVIFTESVRTQRYLFELLSNNGYAGQIVLMNGSNSDPSSKQTYKEWLDRNKGSDRISGSKSADMKAAVVDAFRGDEKTILIATESGAEGINLQFCSLIINFDLPWNPQRVEQRIGRCHRYGQKIDVAVVNMLNLKNRAEYRIYELLKEKFHLFEGVFGSSDEVLGSIESGTDFERKVLEIVQSSRTSEEIDREFDRLQEELKDTIEVDMADARAKLIETLDEEVVAKLKTRKGSLTELMNDFERRLLMVAEAELPGVSIKKDPFPHFTYEGTTYSTRWPDADARGWSFFRPSEGSLGFELITRAKARELPRARIIFDHAAYAMTLADVRALVGKSGSLTIAKVRVEAAGSIREQLSIACVDQDGTPVSKETVDRLFLVPAIVSAAKTETDPALMRQVEEEQTAAIRKEIDRQNAEWLDQESLKLDLYADDLEQASEVEIKSLETEIKAAKKALRANTSLGMAEKIAEQRRIKRLEDQRDEQRLNMFQKRREIRKEVDDMLDQIAASLEAEPQIIPILSVEWAVVE